MSAEFLAATELDDLAEIYARLEPAEIDFEAIAEVLEEWNDVQALANLLMYPDLIPLLQQADALARGLTERNGYLRLAAAVGVGQLERGDLDDDELDELVPRLLDLIRRDVEVTATRASASLAAHLRPKDAEAVSMLLPDASADVKANLEIGLARYGMSDSSGVESAADLPRLAYIPNLSEWQTGGRA